MTMISKVISPSPSRLHRDPCTQSWEFQLKIIAQLTNGGSKAKYFPVDDIFPNLFGHLGLVWLIALSYLGTALATVVTSTGWFIAADSNELLKQMPGSVLRCFIHNL